MEKKSLGGSYAEPVARLLALGEPKDCYGEWEDQPGLGLGAEHVPDLIRMATDEELHTADSESAEVWAPLHAWRALGRLGAEEAVEPLLGMLHRVDDEEDDWLADDLPEVMASVGAGAVPALAAHIKEEAHGVSARITASMALSEIGRWHPAERDVCVAALTSQLEHFAVNGEDLNGFLISALLDLDGVEAAPVMERAFEADAVDLTLQGDWEDVQIELRLLTKRITPRPRSWGLGPAALGENRSRAVASASSSGKKRVKTKKKKAQRKAQKKARKKNRRK